MLVAPRYSPGVWWAFSASVFRYYNWTSCSNLLHMSIASLKAPGIRIFELPVNNPQLSQKYFIRQSHNYPSVQIESICCSNRKAALFKPYLADWHVKVRNQVITSIFKIVFAVLDSHSVPCLNHSRLTDYPYRHSFLVFLSFYKRMPGYYFQIGHSRLFEIDHIFAIHYHLPISFQFVDMIYTAGIASLSKSVTNQLPFVPYRSWRNCCVYNKKEGWKDRVHRLWGTWLKTAPPAIKWLPH